MSAENENVHLVAASWSRKTTPLYLIAEQKCVSRWLFLPFLLQQ